MIYDEGVKLDAMMSRVASVSLTKTSMPSRHNIGCMASPPRTIRLPSIGLPSITVTLVLDQRSTPCCVEYAPQDITPEDITQANICNIFAFKFSSLLFIVYFCNICCFCDYLFILWLFYYVFISFCDNLFINYFIFCYLINWFII